MNIKEKAGRQAASGTAAAKVFEVIKLDYATIKIIVLTTMAVLALLSIPMFFVVRNFVTFDALDHLLKVTDSVRPKILHDISEELDTGYSKNFLFDSPRMDNTMLFFATQGQRVTVSLDAIAIQGEFQPVRLQLNGCSVGPDRTDALHMYEYDLTRDIERCAPDEPNLHTLRIALPNGVKKGSVLQVKCLVLVYQRVHQHLEVQSK